jgi:hypothetical protein
MRYNLLLAFFAFTGVTIAQNRRSHMHDLYIIFKLSYQQRGVVPTNSAWPIVQKEISRQLLHNMIPKSRQK